VPTDNAARFATMGVVKSLGRLIRNASKQARQVSKGSRRLTPGCCFAVPFGLSELVKMLRWFRRRSQTIRMLDLTFEKFALKYRLPDIGHDASCTSQLGRGGASSGVERLVATPTPGNCTHSQLQGAAPSLLLPSCRRIARATGTVFAVKHLSTLHRIDFPFLLANEMSSLWFANRCNIPHVIVFEEVIFLPDGSACMIIE